MNSCSLFHAVFADRHSSRYTKFIIALLDVPSLIESEMLLCLNEPNEKYVFEFDCPPVAVYSIAYIITAQGLFMLPLKQQLKDLLVIPSDFD